MLRCPSAPSILSLLFAATATSCVAPVDDVGFVTAAAGPRHGVDYSWGRPSPSALVAGGYTFAARYLSWDTTGKNLTRAEADRLIGAGIDVVSNWEHSAGAARNGRAQGVEDATEAQRQATACGAPADRPIYFSVDFDASEAQQPAIDAYFDGVASVIGRERTGAYAGYWVIKRLFDAGKITYGWQTYAWSGGMWDSRAQLRQVQNGVTIGGAACDIDHAVANDFGQWPMPSWSAAYVNQTFPLAADDFLLAPNEESSGYIELRNTGSEPWEPGHTFLGTTEPRDGPSPLAHPSWINDHRAATVDHTVMPGETGRFELIVRAPAELGDYPQYFNLVEEGVAWFSDSGVPPDDQLQIRVTVVAPSSCPMELSTDWACEGASRIRCGADGTVERVACATSCADGACVGEDPPDAGPAIDADGGVPSDGAIASADGGVTGPPTAEGCACRITSAAPTPTHPMWLALAGLFGLRRARRARART
ncbi:MAG: glycoside hydrolase domain-containing protein [Sandaracinaceae bacterium]